VLSGFVGAAQFLTRVPVRTRTAPDLARSVPWFPIVGGVIGAVVGVVAAGLQELVPSAVAAALAIAVGMALTGAFHEDGLADTADALGGWSPQQRREILKDSRHGSYGVAAMCTSIVLRVLCVASLGPAAAFAGLVAAHSLGRASAVAVMGSAPARAGDGLGAGHANSVTRAGSLVGAAGGVLIGALATGWWIGPLALAAAVGALAVAVLAVRAFEQISGDHLGAIEQVGECLVLVVTTGLASRHALWWT
jgi:adenosylcobinamide-GDP ribazoletransferase